MKWSSQKDERGDEYTVEGWHLDDPADYDRMIVCKRCGKRKSINDFTREGLKGFQGDVVASEIWYLRCSCYARVAMLDERNPRYCLGPSPLLTILEDGSWYGPYGF